MRQAARLRTLARKYGYCPVHLTRLWCVICEAPEPLPGWIWTGTYAEREELLTFVDRLLPSYEPLLTLGRCHKPGCDGSTFCEACYAAMVPRVPLPADLFTGRERARLGALLAQFRREGHEQQTEAAPLCR